MLQNESFLLLLIVVLILLSAFFSCVETSMMALNRYRLRHRVQINDHRASLIANLLKRPDRLLGSILIGNTCTNIFAAALTTILGFRLYGDIGVATATAMLTLAILLLGEIMPKTMAAHHPEKVAYATIMPLRFMLWILYPAAWVMNGISNGLLKLFGVRRDVKEFEQLSQEEFRTFVNESSGVISSNDKDMLLGVLDLRAMTVDDVMVPRSDIVGIDLVEPWEDILEDLINCQHTRLPLFEDDINQVKGIVHVRNILQLLANKSLTKRSLLEMADEIYFIQEGTTLTTQLVNFQQNKCRTGFVVDEYGEIQGLITLEDILEEVVGDFTTSITQLRQEVYPESSGSFLVDGSANIRDLNRAMGWAFPTEGPKTLNGLIIEDLEVIPERPVCLRIAGYPLEIVKIQDNTVKIVRVYPALRDLKKKH